VGLSFPERCYELADGDPAAALLLAVRAVQAAAKRDDLRGDAVFASVREAALLLRSNGHRPAIPAVGDTTAEVAGEEPGKLETQVRDLVGAARELDAALAAHWQPLKRALHDWENTAASIPGVQLTHDVLAQLEPELAEQLQLVAKVQRRKR
jgi:hypothetical protein